MSVQVDRLDTFELAEPWDLFGKDAMKPRDSHDGTQATGYPIISLALPISVSTCMTKVCSHYFDSTISPGHKPYRNAGGAYFGHLLIGSLDCTKGIERPPCLASSGHLCSAKIGAAVVPLETVFGISGVAFDVHTEEIAVTKSLSQNPLTA
jgi:hypothetical protein